MQTSVHQTPVIVTGPSITLFVNRRRQPAANDEVDRLLLNANISMSSKTEKSSIAKVFQNERCSRYVWRFIR